MRNWAGALVVAAAIATGCSGGKPASTDAGPGARDAAADAGALPPLPAPPAPPATPLLACPPGWRTIAAASDGAPTTCDPWPEGGTTACAAAEAWLPGAAGCLPIGAACPTGEWPDDLPATGVLFVRAGATAGGAGTRASPFGTIAEATASAAAGSTIALSAGTFEEAVRLPAAVTLRGACVARTRVSNLTAAAAPAAVVESIGRGAVIRDLTIAGARVGVTVQTRSRSVELRGVLIDGAVSVGVVAANGAELVASDVVVRHVRADTAMTGHGVGVIFGATATLSRIVVDDATDASIVAAGVGTHVSLSDAALHDTRPDAAVQVGHALLAFDGAFIEASRCAIERMRRVAVLAANGGTRISVSDSVIRDTLPATPGGSEGRGVSCDTGAHCELRALHVAGGRHVGVRVGGTGTTATLTDVVVSGVLADESSGVGGYGVSADHGAMLALERGWLEANHDTGLLLTEAGTVATVSDLTIRATEPVGPELGFGRGIDIERGPSLTATRVRLDANHNLGVFVQGPDASATFDDVEVTDTRVRGDGKFGRGLHAQEGASVTIRRGRFAGNREAAITAADPGTAVDLTDVDIVGTLSNGDDAFGRGLEAAAGSRVVGLRVSSRGNRDVGACAFGEGSTLTLTDVVIVATASVACDGCAPSGIGAGAYRGGALELRRFVVADNALIGLQLASDGQMDLHDGEIARQPVGLNLQVAPYDVARLMDDVRFVDNERPLDSEFLPVPDPTERLP